MDLLDPLFSIPEAGAEQPAYNKEARAEQPGAGPEQPGPEAEQPAYSKAWAQTGPPAHGKISVLNAAVSRPLVFYYRHVHPPMKFRLWGLARRLTGYARLTVPYADGGWITLDERDWIQVTILADGTYEPEVWDALSAFVERDEVVWDVGAHIGGFAIRALQHAGVREVRCFEPNPATAAILRLNLGLNRGLSHCHQLALSDVVERRPLTAGLASNTGMAHLVMAGPVHGQWSPGAQLRPTVNRGPEQSNRPTEPGPDEYVVECTTVDMLLGEPSISPPTLMKLDVEDWEKRVLHGARRLLEMHPPKALVFESRVDSAGNLTDTEIAGYLGTFGYSVWRIPRPQGRIEERENFLAVHAAADGSRIVGRLGQRVSA